MKGINNFFFGFIVILALILIVPNFMKKEHVAGQVGYSNPSLTIDDCDIERQSMIDDGVACVGDCIKITIATNSCDSNHDFSSLMGNYHFLYSETLTCTNPLIHQQHIPWDCYYEILQPPICNTPADTNCDNCVATSELISLINKWVSNTETTSNLITAINAWTSGTC